MTDATPLHTPNTTRHTPSTEVEKIIKWKTVFIVMQRGRGNEKVAYVYEHRYDAERLIQTVIARDHVKWTRTDDCWTDGCSYMRIDQHTVY